MKTGPTSRRAVRKFLAPGPPPSGNADARANFGSGTRKADRKPARRSLARWVALCVAGAWAGGCQRHAEPEDALYRQVTAQFQCSQPIAVNLSPDGRYVLHKSDEGNGFRITVQDRESGQPVASSFSRHTQGALTWRPDSRAIAFQETVDLERPLCLWDWPSGRVRRLAVPVSQTALSPLRWDPSGKRIAYFHGDWRRGRLLVADTEPGRPPQVVLESLSGTCDFGWAPDGTRIAVVSALTPGVIAVVTPADASATRLPVGGQIGEVAWAPDGQSLLATVRGERDEYFRLVEVDVASGANATRAEAAGDIKHPVWLPDGRAFLYHVLSNGITVAVLGDREHPQLRMIGPTDGVVRVTHVAPDGTRAFARYAALTTPPALIEIPLHRDGLVVAYAPPRSAEIGCPKPEFIRVMAPDGTGIPAYHWRAQELGQPADAVLIVVHGGLHTQTFPTWEAYLRVMLERGCDVLAVNYRGSSGYGAQFERMGSEPERVDDVLAAREYAVKVLGIAPGRVFLTGISRGAGLIAAAAARGKEIGGLILVSWVGVAPQEPAASWATPFPVIALHGEDDPTMSPRRARETLRQFFGSGKTRPNLEFHVLEDEGHFFYKTASWARVYWAALRLMNPK